MSTAILRTIRLMRRDTGLHTQTSRAVRAPANLPIVTATGDEPVIDEDLLIALLPSDFLPQPVDRVLLTLEDDDGNGSTAIRNPARFRAWGKYFPAFVVEVGRPESAA